MAIYKETSGVGGKWLDKEKIEKGDLIKIMTEAEDIPNRQGEGMQTVCKVLVKGKSKEPENLAINKPSRNAFIKEFGEDSKDWVGKIVSAEVRDVVVGGKAGIALYLIPDGMKLKKSDDNFLFIGHEDDDKPKTDYKDDAVNEDAIRAEDIPF